MAALRRYRALGWLLVATLWLQGLLAPLPLLAVQALDTPPICRGGILGGPPSAPHREPSPGGHMLPDCCTFGLCTAVLDLPPPTAAPMALPAAAIVITQAERPEAPPPTGLAALPPWQTGPPDIA